jgi:nitrile hydratase beta subunit
MDGIHDLAGMAGFGSIEIEANEPVFHERWESRAFALNVLSIAVLQAYNADEYRHAIERMAPVHYLEASYYERVLTGAATLLVEKGIVSSTDLDARAGGRFPLAGPAVANAPSAAPDGAAPRYDIGETVRVRDTRPSGHTRAPRYCRGKKGRVLQIAPPFVFPDDSAHGGPLRKEHTYQVEFKAADLWGESAGKGDTVIVDLWETYLEPVR